MQLHVSFYEGEEEKLTQRKRPYKDGTERLQDAGLEDWSDIATSEGILTARSQKQQETDSLLEGEYGSSDTLISAQ